MLCILLSQGLFGFVWFVFKMMNESILKEWTVKALYELDCLALLIGVAVLWRQEQNAKEFPYAIQHTPKKACPSNQESTVFGSQPRHIFVKCVQN